MRQKAGNYGLKLLLSGSGAMALSICLFVFPAMSAPIAASKGLRAGDSRVLILNLLLLGSLISIILARAIWKWSQRRLIPTNLDAFAPELDEP